MRNLSYSCNSALINTRIFRFSGGDANEICTVEYPGHETSFLVFLSCGCGRRGYGARNHRTCGEHLVFCGVHERCGGPELFLLVETFFSGPWIRGRVLLWRRGDDLEHMRTSFVCFGGISPFRSQGSYHHRSEFSRGDFFTPPVPQASRSSSSPRPHSPFRWLSVSSPFRGRNRPR